MLQLDYHKIKEKPEKNINISTWPEASELANLFLLYCIELYWGVTTDTNVWRPRCDPPRKKEKSEKYISYKKLPEYPRSE